MNRQGGLAMATVLAAAMWTACSSSSKPKPDAAGTDGGPTDGSHDLAGGDLTNREDAGAPTVVATLTGVPVSLALSGGNLYFTLSQTAAGNDGKVQTVSTSGGAVTTLASDLRQPGAIAVSGSNVYWEDTEAVSNSSNVMSVSTAGGGTTSEVAVCTTMTRIPIAGASLYGLTNHTEEVSSFPLAGTNPAGTLIVPAIPPNGIVAIDSDGSALFYIQANGAGGQDLFQVPVAGGAATSLATNVTTGSVDGDYLLDDATTVYWSDSGTGSVFSVPRTTGGTPKVLATFNTGSAPVQIVLDGDNIYALEYQTLTRFPKAGGTPVILASVSGAGTDRYVGAPGNVVALAVDDTFVYWTFQAQNEILKIAK
jgi:hypothetical protein